MDIVEFRHSERFGFQIRNWRSISPVYQFPEYMYTCICTFSQTKGPDQSLLHLRDCSQDYMYLHSGLKALGQIQRHQVDIPGNAEVAMY